jgi:hypothetical protein
MPLQWECEVFLEVTTKTNKLRGFSPQSELYRPSEEVTTDFLKIIFLMERTMEIMQANRCH